MKEQIKRSISKQPPTLEEFRKAINNLTYAEIAEIWRQERLNNEEQEMQAPPIKYVADLNYFIFPVMLFCDGLFLVSHLKS